ncbi:MAG: hypothetical protein IGBAC_0697 [Ignavibacteriae bacterium]|nr:MAG: hypothetical protein IGBAC_0697 [Ignavibacteriota bacterium]
MPIFKFERLPEPNTITFNLMFASGKFVEEIPSGRGLNKIPNKLDWGKYSVKDSH